MAQDTFNLVRFITRSLLAVLLLAVLFLFAQSHRYQKIGDYDNAAGVMLDTWTWKVMMFDPSEGKYRDVQEILQKVQQEKDNDYE